MKRSEINFLIQSAMRCYGAHGWALPPNARWDITDFGLGDWRRFGLVLVNLAEEPEYCDLRCKCGRVSRRKAEARLFRSR